MHQLSIIIVDGNFIHVAWRASVVVGSVLQKKNFFFLVFKVPFYSDQEKNLNKRKQKKIKKCWHLSPFSITQPYFRNSLHRPNRGYHPRHRPRHPSCPRHHLPSSADSGSSRPVCAVMLDCRGPAGSGCPEPIRSTPSPRRCRRWQMCWMEQRRGLLGIRKRESKKNLTTINSAV
jgi:hypothetical protein